MSNCFSTPCPPSSSGPCPSYPKAPCVVYTGSNLLCSGIKTNDRLDAILVKIDALLCTGGGGEGGSFITAGLGIDVDGVGTATNPYVITSTVGANNGLTFFSNTLTNPPFVKLGQIIGQTGDPAQLLYDSEIPLADFTLALNNNAGTGADVCSITFETSNVGNSHSTILIEAIDYTAVEYSVNNTIGTMETLFTGGGTFQGSMGYAISGVSGHFFLSDMEGTTTHTTVEIAGTATQQWNVTGDTTIGLTGTHNTGFGGVTSPTAYIDMAASTATKGSERTRAGTTPSSGYLDGLRWYDGTHYYMRIGGVNKQLDNDNNFGPGDFIQNQFLLPQSTANYWIDGHGRIDDYLQISNTGRLVRDSTAVLSVTSPTSSTTGNDLRVKTLRFFDNSSPSNAASCTSTISCSQGDFITIHAATDILFDCPQLALTQHTSFNMGGSYPLIFQGGSSDSLYPFAQQTYIDLRNVNAANGSADATNVFQAFTASRTTGGVTMVSRIGAQLVDYTNAAYKGDLLFQTVSAVVNSGAPTEYLRLKYDGRIIAAGYSTLLTAPTTTGVKHMLTCDESGLFSHEAIPAGGAGSVTSVALSMPTAFTVTNSPITSAGILIVTGAGTVNQAIRGDGTLGGIPISALNAAVATNSINSGSFGQTWAWNTLAGGVGLTLSTSSTAATGNSQTLLYVNSTGANTNSNQTTYSAAFINNHTGTGSTNIAAEFLSSGGATNIDAAFYGGVIQLGLNGASRGIIKLHGSTTGILTVQPPTSFVAYTLTLPTSAGSSGQILSTNGAGVLSWTSFAPSAPISSLTPALSTNTIDNGNFKQTWNWNSLSSNIGLALNAATTAAGSGSVLFSVFISGVNGAANQTNGAAQFINTKTGAGFSNNVGVTASASGASQSNTGISATASGSSTSNTGVYATASGAGVDNYGIRIDVSGGTNNHAIAVNSGDVQINTLAAQPSATTLVSNSSVLGYVTIGTGLSVDGSGVLNATVAGAQTFQSTLTTGSTLTGNNTVAGGGFNFVWNNFADYTVNATNKLFLKVANYASATIGDVVTLVSTATGEVHFAAPGAGSSGTVTSFSAGDLAPLFTTTEATVTTTPALSFVLTNAAADSYFGNQSGSAGAPSYITAGTFTKTDDTNVTATITGTATNAVLKSFGVTLGWTGTLGVARGGTNLASYTIGDTTYASGATTISKLGIGTAGQILRVNAGATAPEWYTQTFNSGTVTNFSAGDLSPLFTTTEATTTTTPALSFVLTNAGANTYFGNATGGATSPSYTAAGALTTVSDTNIVITVGGNSATSLLRAASITASWNGTLGVARGGTNIASYAAGDIIYASGATTLSKLAIGGPGQQLRVNAGATALEYFTAGPGITSLNTLTAAAQFLVIGSAGTDFNIDSTTATHTFNIPTAGIGITRGLLTNIAQTFDGLKTHNIGTIVNESGANTAAGGDFRVESDTNINAIVVDATNNRVGVLGVPTFAFDVAAITTRIQGNVGIGVSPSSPVLSVGGALGTDTGISVTPTISTTANSSASLVSIIGTIIEAASGTHTILSALSVAAPTVTSGLATVTNAATIYVAGAPSATVIGANFAMLINSGTFRANNDWVMGAGTSYSTGGYDLLVRNQGTGRLETLTPDVLTFNSQSGLTYQLVATDRGAMVQRTNASAQTVTIPTNAVVAFPIGTQILVEQTGTGQITFTPAGGVTMNSAGGATKSRVQWVICTLIKTATNTWTLSGDITT